MKKYAAIIMRCQPPHNAHVALIQRIINDGYTPVVLLGSADSKDLQRNPYSFDQRHHMLDSVFPGISAEPLNDYEDWDSWVSDVENLMDIYGTEVLYTFNKEEDLYGSFNVRGEEYINAYFTDAIKATVVNIEHTDFPDLHARDVREDLEKHKHLIPPSVYEMIK